MIKRLLPLLLALFLWGCGEEEVIIPPADDAAAAAMDAGCAPYAEEELRWSAAGSCTAAEGRAHMPVTLSYIDAASFAEGLAAETEAALAARLEEVTHASELCADGSYRPEILKEVWEAVLETRFADRAAYRTESSFTLQLRYSEAGGWAADNAPEIPSLAGAVAAEEEKLAGIVPPRKIYRLDPYATVGPVPDPEGYHICEDAAGIDELLQRPEAQILLNGRSTVWDSQRERKEGTKLYAYLDETILVLVWQETDVPATLTFAEVFIADASQLIRKLADDSFGSQRLIVPTEFARQTNAVMLTDGDFYQLRGGYGINVYQGEIRQFNSALADSCFFDKDGNMIFSYAGELATLEEAEQFVADNDIWSGIAFGPVMVDGGVNVCPPMYYVGDYLGELARCSFSQVDELHYLITTTDYFFSVTDLADLLVERGVQSAYNIDGGQSSAIILMGKQRNPNIFNQERAQSDCIFFASALPDS